MNHPIDNFSWSNCFTFSVSEKFKPIFYMFIAIYSFSIVVTIIDVFYIHFDFGNFYITKISNAILWLVLIFLIKSRQKATYYNYGYITIVLVAMFITNNYLFNYYEPAYLAKPAFMIFLFGFLIALPLHEYHKLSNKK